MASLVTTFTLEALITMASIFAEDLFREHFTMLQSTYCALNIISMVTVLTVFTRLVTAARREFERVSKVREVRDDAFQTT